MQETTKEEGAGKARKASMGGQDGWKKSEILRLLNVIGAYAPGYFLDIREPVSHQ